jgi:hypothetical protein
MDQGDNSRVKAETQYILKKPFSFCGRRIYAVFHGRRNRTLDDVNLQGFFMPGKTN